MKKIIFSSLMVLACLFWQENQAQTTHSLNWDLGAMTTPVDLTIDVGDTVTWTFTDGAPHSVTSDAGSTETFDSGILSGIGTTFSHTFTLVGSNPYHCNVHPMMTGTITVNAVPAGAVCGGNFYDSGGVAANYSSNENITTTISPVNPGDVVTVTFTSFDVEATWDALYVYNGPDATFPIIDSGNPVTQSGFPSGGYYGTTIPGPFTSSDPSGALTFVFMSDGLFEFSGWEANVTCAPPPSCLDPTNLTATNIMATSADLGWTENNTPAVSLWDVHVVTAGSPAPTGTTTPTDAGVMANPYTKTGLTAQTAYEFYVRSDCGGGNKSAWIGPFSFFTGYCASVPSNNDGNGITNIQVGTTNYTGTDVTYLDFTGGTVENLPQNVLANVQVTFETGFTYDTNIWIDFNDDFVFDNTTELVFSGVSTSNNPTTLDASFMMPGTAALGNHRMRIGTADFGQNPPDPCYNGSFGVTADLIVNVVAPPSCLPPSSLTATNIMATSADLGWTENNTPAVSLWDVHVVTAGSPAPTGTTTPTDAGVMANPYTKTGLTAQTAYEFYVRADCGGSQSSWTGPFAFTTPCVSVALPYFEDFASGTFPACWTRSSTTDVTIEATCGTRTNVLRFDQSEEAITVPIDATTATSLAVSYYIADSVCGSGADPGEIFHVDYWDGTQWVTAKVYDAARPDAYTLETFYVPQSALSNNFKVRFDQIDGSTDSWFIDDVMVQQGPTCLPPTNLTVTGLTAISADLGWTENNAATTWDVYVVTAGSPAPTATTTPTDAGVTTNPYNKTGLTAQTAYEFYVRTDCGTTNGKSTWTGPFAFTTPCLSATLPYFEDFASGTFPACWTNSNPTYVVIEATCGTRTNVLRFDNGEQAVTGPIDATTATSLAVSYYIADSVCGQTADPGEEFYVEYWDGTQWVRAKTYDAARPNAFTLETFYVPQSALTTTFKLRFDQGPAASSTDSWLVDDVMVQQGPTCLPPNNLTATNFTANGADLGWTDINTTTAGSYDVEIVIAGAAPTGTPTATGVTNPYTATGLNPCEVYEFYVRANCSPTDSSVWSGPFQFTTGAGAVGSFSENFDSYPTGVLPACWTSFISSTTSTSVFVEIAGFNSFSQPNNLELDDSGDSAVILYAITPQLTDLPLGTHQMRFQARADVGDVTLEIGTMTDPTDATTFTSVQTLATTDNYQEFIVLFNAATTDQYIAFKASYTSTFSDANIDDVFWEPIPTCTKPNTLTATNILQSSADLGWTDTAGASMWDIEVVLSGTPPTGIPTDPGVMSNPYTKTGLTPNTSYDFYVRADCGTTSSVYEGPFTFLTDCVPIVAPWTDDVEAFPDTTSFSVLNCWTTTPTTGDYDWNVEANGAGNSSGTGPDNPNSGVAYFYVEASSPAAAGDVAELVSPQIDVSGLNTPQLEFYYHMFGSVMGDLHVDVHDGTAWVNDVVVISGQQQTAGSDPWLLQQVILGNFSGIIQVRFRAVCAGSFQGDISLDDISIVEAPPCLPPTGVAANQVTDVSADITWVAGGTETEWEIEYGATGFAPGTGAGTLVADNDGTLGETLTGLIPSTTYDLYVTAICGPGYESAPAGPISFTTLAFPPCFDPSNIIVTVIDDTSADVSWTSGGSGETEWEIEYGLTGFTPGSGTIVADNDGILGETLTSLIPNTAYDVYVSAICGPTNPSGQVGPVSFTTLQTCFDVTSITATVNSDTSVLIGWTAGGTETEWEIEYGAPGFTLGSGTIILDNDATAGETINGLTPATAYEVYVTAICNPLQSNPVGPIAFTTFATCFEVTNIVITGVTDTTADVSWTPGGAEVSWEVEYGLTGFAPGTGAGTIVVDNDGTLGVSLSGLAPSTDYDVYVTAICTQNQSAAAGPAMFRTLPTPPVCDGKFYDTGGPNGDFFNNEDYVVVINPVDPGDAVTASFTFVNNTTFDILIVDTGDGTPEIVPEIDPSAGDPPVAYTSAAADGSLSFRFISSSVVTNPGWEADITCAPLGIQSQAFEGFAFYPNPVSSQLTLKAVSQIEQVVIYDLLGQEVLKTRPNNLSPTLNLDELQSATYLMKVTINGSVGVYRIIKE